VVALAIAITVMLALRGTSLARSTTRLGVGSTQSNLPQLN
jgi:hypothetical protein